MGRQQTVTVDVPEGIDREGGSHQHDKHDKLKNNFQATWAVTASEDILTDPSILRGVEAFLAST